MQEKFRLHSEIVGKGLVRKQQEKTQRAVERWNNLLISRENNKTLNELLLQAHDRQIKINIQKRKEKLETAMKRTNEKFLKFKADQVRARYKHYHKDNVKKAMQNGIRSVVKRRRRSRRILRIESSQKSCDSIDSNEFGSEEKLIVITEPRSINSSRHASEASFYSITTVY